MCFISPYSSMMRKNQRDHFCVRLPLSLDRIYHLGCRHCTGLLSSIDISQYGVRNGDYLFAYFSFLASSLIGYFANYKQTLLGADQKNYVVTAYFQTATIAKTLIQMASAYYTGSYYLWVAIELTFGIIYSFILNWK